MDFVLSIAGDEFPTFELHEYSQLEKNSKVNEYYSLVSCSLKKV